MSVAETWCVPPANGVSVNAVEFPEGFLIFIKLINNL